MRRRVDGDSGGSLELLLDTMCNAFGGVMFIAMLVAILSQFVEFPSPDPWKETLKKLRAERDRLNNIAKGLEATLNGQQAIIKAIENDPKQPKLPEVLAINAKLDTRIKNAAGEIKDIEKEMANLLNKPLPLPTLGHSSKATFWMIVRWNRLYLCFDPVKFPEHAPYDADAVKDAYNYQASSFKFTTVNGKGIDLTKNWKDSDGIAKIISELSPPDHSLHFAVYPDSYAAFIRVRNFLTSNEEGKPRFSYNWRVMNQEPILPLGKGITEDM